MIKRRKIICILIIIIIVFSISSCKNNSAIGNFTDSDSGYKNDGMRKFVEFYDHRSFLDMDFDAGHAEQIDREWYDEVIRGFKQKMLSKMVADEKVISEYRVVYNVALQRYDYYSLQVFADGTGKFTFMVHKSEDFEEGSIILNESKTLDSDETQKLMGTIRDNDFYNIPTIHPDQFGIAGSDGTTVFIEGYDNGKLHFITMWMPDEKYAIYKIHKAFADFADTIAKRPEIVFD